MNSIAFLFSGRPANGDEIFQLAYGWDALILAKAEIISSVHSEDAEAQRGQRTCSQLLDCGEPIQIAQW